MLLLPDCNHGWRAIGSSRPIPGLRLRFGSSLRSMAEAAATTLPAWTTPETTYRQCTRYPFGKAMSQVYELVKGIQ